MITRRKTDLIQLIEGRLFEIHSFEEPVIENGLWKLEKITEIDQSSKSGKIREKVFIHPVPVMLDLHKGVLIYGFGRRKSRPLPCSIDLNGVLTVAHLLNGKILTGNYRRRGNSMIWGLKYLQEEELSVLLEFQKYHINQ